MDSESSAMVEIRRRALRIAEDKKRQAQRHMEEVRASGSAEAMARVATRFAKLSAVVAYCRALRHRERLGRDGRRPTCQLRGRSTWQFCRVCRTVYERGDT